MDAIIPVVTPVFGLILLGFLAGRFHWVPQDAGRGLAAVIFTIAMPAMLFRTMVDAKLPEAPVGLWVAYFGATGIVWILAAVSTRLVLGRPQTIGVAVSMAASFSNNVVIGIPLVISHFGADIGAAPVALIIAFDVPILWLAASIHLAFAEGAGSRTGWKLMLDVPRRLVTSPIVMSLVLGAAWRLTGLGIAPLAERTIGLLAQAAIPGALLALGLTLATFRLRGQLPTLAIILALKLVAMPAVTWIVAVHWLAIPYPQASVLILLAGLPTGINAFLFASAYDKAQNSVAGAIGLSTFLAAITVSALIALLPAG